MSSKPRQPGAEPAAAFAFGMPLPDHFKDSAQQIWLAGLGAFSKVQAEGGKVFDTLVNDGLALQRKSQALAEERIAEATSRMSHLGSDLSQKAAGQMDKLENIFEDRVAKALHKLGVPSAQDMAALLARVDELNRELLRLNTAATGTAPARARRTAATPKPAAAAQPRKRSLTANPAATAANQASKAPRKTAARKA